MADTDVLVITGGGGGMGLACACALADRGRLLLVDVDEGQLEEARSVLSGRGASVETLRCDVTSPADVAAVADRVRAAGRFRCLVHTVGVSPEMADARTIMEVDLVGSARVIDAMLPLAGPGSSAILFGSIAGYSEVDPAIEALLCDPLADDLFTTVEQALGEPIDSA